MTPVDDEVQENIKRMVEAMPAFPRSVHKVLELTSDMNCAPKDIVETIEHDPVMTAKMLKLVNSAFYSLPRKITSMKHAVIYIGINTVKNLALSIALWVCCLHTIKLILICLTFFCIPWLQVRLRESYQHSSTERALMRLIFLLQGYCMTLVKLLALLKYEWVAIIILTFHRD